MRDNDVVANADLLLDPMITVGAVMHPAVAFKALDDIATTGEHS
jgi:hypothetical protein